MSSPHSIAQTSNPHNGYLHNALDVASFAFFALSLAIPSGYSYGSGALALLCLAACVLSRHQPCTAISRETWSLMSTLLLMGTLWCMSYDGWLSPSGWGFAAKYALATLILWRVSQTGIRLPYVAWGLALGAAGSLAIALYQAKVLHMPRPGGYTNAIQFGGIAMYLGFAAVTQALLSRETPWKALLMGLCGGCGVMASFLSDSRGSWVVMPLLVAAIWLMAWCNGFKRLAMLAATALVVVGVGVGIPSYSKLEQRAALAQLEAAQYLNDPQKYAVTSVGQRLEQWRVATHLIEERPLQGWGLNGYRQAKQAMVDAGKAHPSVMDYGHAHNEILDMWVKRGLIGILLLLAFYAVPLFIFWPTPSRLARTTSGKRFAALAIRATAALLPLAYFGFGWTQVFFAHNSGQMFYIISIAVFWGSISQLEKMHSWQRQLPRNE